MLRKLCFSVLSVFGASTGQAASTKDVPRITIDDLKTLVDDPESEVIVLDVRTGSSWAGSVVMIKGATRENPDDFYSWVDKHPQDETIIFYCT